MGVFVGYAAVSTKDSQASMQIKALKAAGCQRIFTEKASGMQRDRPEFRAALESMGKGDTLVILKLDRLADSLKQLIETIEVIEEREIGFRSITESLDTTTAGGKAIFHIFASIRELENLMIGNRTKAGMETAKAKGKICGRPRALKGKDLELARGMLRDPDIKVKDVARKFGVSTSTLYRNIPVL
jgi:DNA invertase Pin-like site-specific DNA recombinase